MPEFQKLKLKQFPQIQERETSESKYWRSFKLTSETQFHGAPNCIHFNPNDSGSYLVTGSTKVTMFNSLNDRVVRSFSRFNDEAYSGMFRKDGRVVIAGDKSGFIRVFDAQSKSILRELKRHSSAVRASIWASDGLHMISGSDDTKVKYWDLGTQEVVWESSGGHTDYVRTLASNPVSEELFVSGSYDHSVRIWDCRQPKAVGCIDHGHPVESCLITPSGTMMISAGGNKVSIWDLLKVSDGPSKPMHTFSSHQKNVTTIALDGSSSRLLSGGLDGHIKVYSLQTMQVTHGIKVGSPILTIAVSAENRKLIVGFVDGRLSARTKQESPGSLGASAEEDDTVEDAAIRTVTVKERFYKGAGLSASSTDVKMIDSERRVRLRPYEKQLQKFSYQQALDAALRTHNPLVIVTVLEELQKRSGITIALSGRDEVTLEPLLSFVSRYVSHPRYAKLIIQVAHRIVDLYASVLGRSDAIDELFLKLQRQVRCEVGFQRQAMRILGSLDSIISASVSSSSLLSSSSSSSSSSSLSSLSF